MQLVNVKSSGNFSAFLIPFGSRLRDSAEGYKFCDLLGCNTMSDMLTSRLTCSQKFSSCSVTCIATLSAIVDLRKRVCE